MRYPKFLYVVFVRLRTGSTVVHATTGDYRQARWHFRDAENRDDCDRISIETYVSARHRAEAAKMRARARKAAPDHSKGEP